MKAFVTALVLSAMSISQAFAGDEHLFWIKINVPGAKQTIEAWVNTGANGINTLHVHQERGTVAQLMAGKSFPKQKITVKALPGFTAAKGGQIKVSYPLGSKLVELRDEGTFNAYDVSSGRRINTVTITLTGVSIK